MREYGNRYEIREAWSSLYGRYGHRIFDTQRQVFVSPWYELHEKASLVANDLNHYDAHGQLRPGI